MKKLNQIKSLLSEFNSNQSNTNLFSKEISHSCGIEEIFQEESPESLDWYKKSLDFGRGVLNFNKKITIDLLNAMHRILMTDQDKATPGSIRTIQVYVGNHIPPAPHEINKYYEDLILFINDSKINSIYKVAWTHAVFEMIHPYIDGNGRIGRMLISLLLWQEQLIRLDRILPISTYMFYNRSDYYKALTKSRKDWDDYKEEKKDLEELSWIRYFLDVLENQLKNEISFKKVPIKPDPNYFKNQQLISYISKLKEIEYEL